ncbi:MAG: hypothetical protein Ta2B_30560 [Termitinemataceae bacterium]|nr:MAG: hypothetical protein Ta2B_30560 [Termitinemataceae bacterium]
MGGKLVTDEIINEIEIETDTILGSEDKHGIKAGSLEENLSKIKSYFDNKDCEMNKPHKNYVCSNRSKKIKGLNFALVIKNEKYEFWWQTVNGISLLENKIKDVKSIFNDSKFELGKKNKEWTRIIIPVKQGNAETAIEECYEIYKKTKDVIGF